MTYAYLGPEGTFSETAARTLSAATGTPVRPYPTVSAVLASVRVGDCTRAVVPLENSSSGVVPATLGELAGLDGALCVDGEVDVPVTFALLARRGADLAGIVRVRSHPHAHSQCTRWIVERLPEVEAVLSDSTASAVREVARSGSVGDAAIAAPEGAARYGLQVLAAGIGDRQDAWTRFLSVRSAGPPPAATGRDRCSLVMTPRDAGPGVLSGLLAEFGARGVSVFWLQSWPEGASLRHYRFFVDVEGHVDDRPVAAALAALRTRAEVTVLGSYPRAVRRTTRSTDEAV